MSNNLIPAAIESMIDRLKSPALDRHLKETHCMMMERSIVALQKAVDDYKMKRYFKDR